MALRTPLSMNHRSSRQHPLPRASGGDAADLLGGAEPAWANGALVGFVLGAGLVGALWLLSKAAHGREPADYIDPYENVPYDDEEPSEEEMRQVAESMAEIARGELIPAHLVLPRRRASA